MDILVRAIIARTSLNETIVNPLVRNTANSETGLQVSSQLFCALYATNIREEFFDNPHTTDARKRDRVAYPPDNEMPETPKRKIHLVWLSAWRW